MDVKLTEEQELLRQSAHDLLRAECPMSLVRKQVDPPERTAADRVGDPFHWQALWDRMSELGWLGLVVPEEYGGAGLGAVDLAVLLEEMGRVLVPAPYFSTVALGAKAIEVAGDATQRAALLPRIAQGELRVTVAQLEHSGEWAPEAIALPARPLADGGHSLSGTKIFVPDAGSADLFVVAARCDAGPTLFLVEAGAPGLLVRAIDYVDRTRPVFELTFDGVEVGADAQLGRSGGAAEILGEVHDFARAALAAEMCGGAQAVLDQSVAYAKTREQFGKPIGSFQAIAHRAADMFVQVESSRSAAYYAAWALAADDAEAHVASCMAKAYCAEAFSQVAGAGVQIHGGLGFTWEQDLHLYFKRAKASEVALGDVAFTRELAAQVLIGPPVDATG